MTKRLSPERLAEILQVMYDAGWIGPSRDLRGHIEAVEAELAKREEICGGYGHTIVVLEKELADARAELQAIQNQSESRGKALQAANAQIIKLRDALFAACNGHVDLDRLK